MITKHLRSRLDAAALNRFRRDEQNRVAMVSRQVMASNQTAGSDDLVAPTRLELEEALVLMARECERLCATEPTAPRVVKGKHVLSPQNCAFWVWVLL